MRIEAGKPQYVGDLRVSLEAPAPLIKTNPGSTAIHEAKHVVAALKNGTGVEGATIVPGAGFLGLTRLSRPDAVAALAPHATGESGTGHDVFIASQMGAIGAESAARSIINSNMDEVMAVAVALEENKSLGSWDIDRAINKLSNPDPEFGILTVETPSGEQKKEKVEIRDNIIMKPVIVFQAQKLN